MELSVHLHQDGVRNTESIPGSLIKRHEHGELVTKVFHSVQFSRICLFATPWTAARQASLSITNSRSLLKLMSIELVTGRGWGQAHKEGGVYVVTVGARAP